MLDRIIDASVRFRWWVLGLAVVLAVLGGRELLKLPIDAVPDITNRQVQITTVAPALGPEEVERQVTFPMETALAGLPGLTETRSLSRHGFSQITAVFTDSTDIYFARNLVNERIQSAREDLPELARSLRERHPGLTLEVLPAAGEQDRLIELLADLALDNPRP